MTTSVMAIHARAVSADDFATHRQHCAPSRASGGVTPGPRNDRDEAGIAGKAQRHIDDNGDMSLDDVGKMMRRLLSPIVFARLIFRAFQAQ